jgi:O-antigen ligase
MTQGTTGEDGTVSTRTGPIAATRLGQPNLGAIALAGTGVALGIALVALPLDRAAWLVILGGLVALAYVAPVAAICLIPWAAAFGSLLTVTVHSFTVTPTDALVAALVIAWLAQTAQAGQLSQLRPRRPAAAHLREWIVTAWRRDAPRVTLVASLLIYLGVVVLSLKVATDRGSVLKEAIKWTEVIVVLAASLWALRSAARVHLVAWAAIGAGVADALIGYAQWAAVSGLAGVDGSLRVFGTFGQPNPFAGYLNLSLALALALLLFGTDMRERWLAGAASVVLFGAEWLSASRGGLIGLAAALAVLLVVGWRRERIAGIALAAGVPLLAIGLLTHAIPSRLTNTALRVLRLDDVSVNGPINNANFSTMERLAHWIAGLNMFRAHPLLGVGAGNYDAAYARYATNLATWPEALGHAHNYYINVAAETGILGLLAFAAVTVSMVWVGWRATHGAGVAGTLEAYGTPNATQVPIHALALGCFAAIAALLVHNLTDDLFVHGMDLQVALTLACLLCLARYRDSG